MFQSSSVEKPPEYRIHRNKKIILPLIYEKLKFNLNKSSDEYLVVNATSNRNKTEAITLEPKKI